MNRPVSISDSSILNHLKLLPFFLLYLYIIIFIWTLYYPANMSWDSMVQYRQAVTGDYYDWHPPIIPFVLKIFFHAGLDISELMLLQCILGVFGIRSLSNAILNYLFRNKLSVYLIEAFTLLTLLLLLSPLTPLMPYLMTFWKDCWLMIIMLWISSIAINSFRINQNPLNVIPIYKLFILIILTTFALLVRHNSITMLPVFKIKIYAKSLNL